MSECPYCCSKGEGATWESYHGDNCRHPKFKLYNKDFPQDPRWGSMGPLCEKHGDRYIHPSRTSSICFHDDCLWSLMSYNIDKHIHAKAWKRMILNLGKEEFLSTVREALIRDYNKKGQPIAVNWTFTRFTVMGFLRQKINKLTLENVEESWEALTTNSELGYYQQINSIHKGNDPLYCNMPRQESSMLFTELVDWINKCFGEPFTLFYMGEVNTRELQKLTGYGLKNVKHIKNLVSLWTKEYWINGHYADCPTYGKAHTILQHIHSGTL